MDKDAFAARLRALRTVRGFTQQELADLVGVTREQVGRWESAESGATQKRVIKICAALGVTPAEFWDESFLPSETPGGQMKNQRSDYTDMFPVGPTILVPLVSEIRAGLPRPVMEETEERYPVDTSVVGNGEYFWLRVQGDSMIEANIHPGDLVLIRLQPEAGNGDIVAAAVVDEGGTLKRFYRSDGRIVLNSENPRYPPMIYPPEKVRVVGVAVLVQRRLK